MNGLAIGRQPSNLGQIPFPGQAIFRNGEFHSGNCVKLIYNAMPLPHSIDNFSEKQQVVLFSQVPIQIIQTSFEQIFINHIGLHNVPQRHV